MWVGFKTQTSCTTSRGFHQLNQLALAHRTFSKEKMPTNEMRDIQKRKAAVQSNQDQLETDLDLYNVKEPPILMSNNNSNYKPSRAYLTKEWTLYSLQCMFHKSQWIFTKWSKTVLHDSDQNQTSCIRYQNN